MGEGKTALVFLAVLVFGVKSLRGAKISGCGTDGTKQITEDTTFQLICQPDRPTYHTNARGTLRWTVSKGLDVAELGVCSIIEFQRFSLNPVNCASTPSSPNVTITIDRAGRSIVSFMTVSKITRELYGEVTCNFTFVDGDLRDVQDMPSSCLLDVVSKTEVGGCTMDIHRQDWTVVGSCDVTKTFSSAERYGCQPEIQWDKASSWTPDRSATVTYRPTPFKDADSHQLNYRGRCSFWSPLQVRPGHLTYSMLFSPGNTRQVAGDILMAAPARSDPQLIDCGSPGYLLENDSTKPRRAPCVCRASSLGNPEGRLMWLSEERTVLVGDYGNITLPFPYGLVDRRHNGKNFTCQLDWVVKSTSVSFKANVAYGPDRAVIRYYNRPFIATGSSNMTLICAPSGVNPNRVHTQWGGLCANQSGPVCLLTPEGKEDDGKEVTCSITNKYTRKTANTNMLLDLSYPPSNPPLIAGYTNQPLFHGDSVTLTCSVKGGKPFVRSVTLSCPALASPVNVTRPGQRVTMTVDVTSRDHASKCICTALWEEEELYSMRASVMLLVFNGTRPGSYSEGHQRGIAVGVGIMVALTSVFVALLAVFVQWRRRRLPSCVLCQPTYDVPETTQTKRMEEHTYSDLNTYEPVTRRSNGSGSSSLQSTSRASRRAENVYVNAGLETAN